MLQHIKDYKTAGIIVRGDIDEINNAIDYLVENGLEIVYRTVSDKKLFIRNK